MSHPPSPVLRAGDADREAAGEALRRHHADGRIDTDELQDRISRCYGARTVAELDALLADLPRDPPTHERSWSHGRGSLPIILPIVLVLTVLGSAAHDHRHAIWPVLVLVFLATAIARRWRLGRR
jgi:hypothetical protein